MKSVKVVFGLVCFFYITSISFASLPLTPGPDMWRSYMSPPRNQHYNEVVLDYDNFHCETYARVGCLEAIYNQVAGLNGTTKVRLRLDDDHCMLPFETDPDVSGYPNYNGAVEFNCGFLAVNSDSLKSWLNYTPVCVRIRYFQSEYYDDWSPGTPVTLDGENGQDPDIFHWMVCVGWGTMAGTGEVYYRFFNQMGNDEDPMGYAWADSGFIDIFEENMSDWFIAGEFPLIYNTYDINNHTVDINTINFYYVPQIYPAFFPNSCTIPNEGDNKCTINGTVYIVGDFIISGYDNELVLGDDTVVKFETSQITSNEGDYSSKNEIIVSGALSVGDNVTFQSIASSPSSGDWGQIKVPNYGFLTIGENVTISDATIGLRIESGGSRIDFPDYSSAESRKCTISNCSEWGMMVSSNPTIENVELTGNGSGILITSGGSAPTFEHITIDNTNYGIYVTYYSNFTLERSILNSTITNHMIDLYSPSSVISIQERHNHFLYTGNGTYHAINNHPSSSYYVEVGFNYWNGVTDSTLLFEYPDTLRIKYFYQKDLENDYDVGAYKTASTIVQNNPFFEAEELETNGELCAARDIYRQVLSTSDNSNDKSLAVKSLIRAYEVDPAISDMRECSSVINQQMSSATDWYKELLCYLLCDLSVKEAQKELLASTLSKEEREVQYRDSIIEAAYQFVVKSDEYSGSPMQVEMLSRAAVLYGDYLNDKTQAKTLADRAASINPGQPILLTAYLSAGCEYDPWKYTDKYHDAEDIPDQPLESNETDDVDISISPNPFNPSTVLTYSLSAPSHVKIAVYSINGQKVAELTDVNTSAGRHSVVFDGSKYASGVYFYRFTSSAGVKTGKMLLVK